MSDLISRADAIEAVCRKCSAETRIDCALGLCSCCDRRELEALPPAETHEIRTETHECVKETHDTDLISRADVLEGLKHSTAYLHDDIYTIVNRIPSAETTGALDEAITKYVADGYMLPPSTLTALPSAEPIERISDNTIVVKYADYEDIGRIILTNGDIFCKMFYEDARQNDDSDYDSLVPDEYKTEPSDLISRADAIEAVKLLQNTPNGYSDTYDKDCIIGLLEELPSAELPKGDLISRADVLKYPIRLDHYDEVNGSREFVYGVESVIEYVESLPSADAVSREAHYDAVANRITDMEERGFVSVVRCKDCRQYIPHDLTEAYGWCCEFKTPIEEDDFCSRGERREP